MSSLFLYSTNTWLKYLIQLRYRNDLHFCWCSDSFDSTKQPAYSSKSLVAPSSNPVNIYRELKRDVDGQDFHSAKIAGQKASLKRLAVEWEKKGEIDKTQKSDIIFMVDKSNFNDWRPLIYVIHRAAVEPRLKPVPMSQRASFAEEWIIGDLARHEFDLIEI